MFQFIVTNIFMVSLGVILYVAVRTLPRIDDSAVPEKRGAWEKWLSSGLPEKTDKFINAFLAKFLRKTKIALLKIDNSVTLRLNKVKQGGNGAQPKAAIDFKAIKDGAGEQNNQIPR